MFELIQIFMGEQSVIDTFLSLADCVRAGLRADFIADGMASHYCTAAI